jgi:protein-S-isoprenylcysteine O-methyltransferase Ste14
MWMLIRQVCAVAVLPGVVTVVIPMWIARRNGIVFGVAADVESAALQILGAGALAIGGALFGASLYYFWSRGRGTLAPWDPPRRFVVEGPYRFVRNPMISGVIFILCGEAAMLRSRPHAVWAMLVVLINAVYIPLLEEPQLAARFGDSYREYRRHVRRFMPRAQPWIAESQGIYLPRKHEDTK